MYEKYQLPYCYNELEPYIDEVTVETHYAKHLQTYLNNLNAIVEKYQNFFEGKSLQYILSRSEKIPKEIRQGVINQGGGVYNHNLYFFLLSPTAKKEPEGKLLEEINKTFGSVDKLKKELRDVSVSIFGSGWGWLVKDKKSRLKIITTFNQDNPLSLGYIPIIGIDVWEHAYYLKYKNLRAQYIENLWNIIDWERVEYLYEEQN